MACQMMNQRPAFVFATRDGPQLVENTVPFLLLPPFGESRGLVDGIMNEQFFSYTVEFDSTERWLYINGDSTLHVEHFHLTSGFVMEPPVSKFSQLYSKDSYALEPNKSIEFAVRFAHYHSLSSSKRIFGFMNHCHINTHSAMLMQTQFFVQKKRCHSFFRGLSS
jgi:hypothetical protein